MEEARETATFFVPGIPRPRKAPQWGKGNMRSGKGDLEAGWSERVHAAALIAKRKFGKIRGPVKVSFLFVFPHPKDKTKYLERVAKEGGVKLAEPGLYITITSTDSPLAKESTPDLDNLEKLVLDAIKDVMIEDDSRVTEKMSAKVWGRRE